MIARRCAAPPGCHCLLTEHLKVLRPGFQFRYVSMPNECEKRLIPVLSLVLKWRFWYVTFHSSFRRFRMANPPPKQPGRAGSLQASLRGLLSPLDGVATRPGRPRFGPGWVADDQSLSFHGCFSASVRRRCRGGFQTCRLRALFRANRWQGACVARPGGLRCSSVFASNVSAVAVVPRTEEGKNPRSSAPDDGRRLRAVCPYPA
ncbi:hypothetical protein GGR36_002454 [Niveibacterium umoris]|uniref:Uncharacterized protein n=1 Tax=Niveibacterium umoris TaxID=1193620 RepID=A0A840BNI9_9RHOO|nr:hypothetical protein [Niveibacterium umoris]